MSDGPASDGPETGGLFSGGPAITEAATRRDADECLDAISRACEAGLAWPR
jgi:hypothetical protein